MQQPPSPRAATVETALQSAAQPSLGPGPRDEMPGIGAFRAGWEMRDPVEPTEVPLVGVDLREPLMTADDVATLLAVPRSSVYEYARRRVRPLPSISIGRHRRFYRSDVEAWLGELRSGAV